MNRFDNIMKRYVNIALSDKQMLKLVNHKANLILYPDIHKYHTIDELLEPYGAAIILYESKPNWGHWCLIFKVNETTLEYFNSYSGLPDNSLKYIPIEFRKKSYQYHPYLTRLMYHSPYQLSYNQYKFQKMDRDVKSCGRWVALRLICRYMSINQFHNMIKNGCKKLGLTKDELVTLITINI
jgi:hypothetical protein